MYTPYTAPRARGKGADQSTLYQTISTQSCAQSEQEGVEGQEDRRIPAIPESRQQHEPNERPGLSPGGYLQYQKVDSSMT